MAKSPTVPAINEKPPTQGEKPSPPPDEKKPLNLGDIGNVLIALPKWILGGAFVCFVGAMLVSLINGQTFLIFDHLNGWARPAPDTAIISQPRTEIEWQQRKYVADLLMGTDNEIQIYIDEIYRCFPEFKTTSKSSAGSFISSTVADKIIDGSMAKSDGTAGEYEFLYKSLIKQLNRLEALASAYQYGVADEKMFEDSYKSLISRWYSRLNQFMRTAKERCKCDWEPIDHLAKKWKIPESVGEGKPLACTTGVDDKSKH